MKATARTANVGDGEVDGERQRWRTLNGDGENGDVGADGDDGGVPVMLAAYRHDVHKLRGRRHDAAAAEFTVLR